MEEGPLGIPCWNEMHYNTSDLLSPGSMVKQLPHPSLIRGRREGLQATLLIKRTYYSSIWAAAAAVISCQWTCQSETSHLAVISIEVPWTWSWTAEEQLRYSDSQWLNNGHLPLASSFAYNQNMQNRRDSVCFGASCLWIFVLQYGNSALLVMNCWSRCIFPSTAETLLFFQCCHTLNNIISLLLKGCCFYCLYVQSVVYVRTW